MAKHIASVLLLLTTCIGCDQVTKQAASHYLKGEPVQSFVGDSVRLLYLENTGAFLGLGAEWPSFVRFSLFTLLTVLMMTVAVGWLFRHLWVHRTLKPYLQTFGVLLVAAGGLGNLVDRIGRDGAVVDFLNVGLGSLRTGVFNVADVQVMVGIGFLLLAQRHRQEASEGASPAP